jgi:NADPH:quinone reductase-like Zn-dependent oxidoreductase
MTLTETPVVGRTIPAEFDGIGYTRSRDGLPLEVVRVAVPRPAAEQVLIHVLNSSLNPLDYKLAELNFLGRTPPVVLGFDLAGVVVAAGEAVTDLAVGDEVAAMADSNGDGGWAVGGTGGYALAREFLAVRKPASLAFRDAAALPICFLGAFKALYGSVGAGDTVYIPGGAGGVGHLAVQIARALGAARVISSGGTPASVAMAGNCGAHHVFNYRQDDIGAEIAKLTGGGVDLVFDSTYNEASFVDTAKMVRKGGIWVVLGAGPGRTSRKVDTESPVDAILAERGARHLNANILRYFTESGTLDAEAKTSLRLALRRAMEWAAAGVVVPHISKVIDSTLSEINAELQSMKMGKGPIGKVAVTIDRSVAR